MSIKDFYNNLRTKFPEITQKADERHIEMWDEIDHEHAHLWFESLAYVLNIEMSKDKAPEKYNDTFKYISASFSAGDRNTRDCIDVAFTENLFWKVPPDKAKPYWQQLPANLQELYVAFHHKEPH